MALLCRNVYRKKKTEVTFSAGSLLSFFVNGLPSENAVIWSSSSTLSRQPLSSLYFFVCNLSEIELFILGLSMFYNSLKL